MQIFIDFVLEKKLLFDSFNLGSAMRLCSTWWDAEGELTPETVDEILLGWCQILRYKFFQTNIDLTFEGNKISILLFQGCL